GLFLNLAWSSNTPEFEASIVEMMETYSVSRNAIFVVLVFIVLPMLTAFEILLYATAMTAMLALTRAPSRGFVATTKIVAYAMVARLALGLPWIGSFVGLVWFMVIVSSGMRRMHRLDFNQTLLVVGVPIVILSMFGFFAFN